MTVSEMAREKAPECTGSIARCMNKHEIRISKKVQMRLAAELIANELPNVPDVRRSLTGKDVIHQPGCHTGTAIQRPVKHGVSWTTIGTSSACILRMHIGVMQGSLTRPDLQREMKYLEKLLYKNRNQHRESQHFHRLQEVSLSFRNFCHGFMRQARLRPAKQAHTHS